MRTHMTPEPASEVTVKRDPEGWALLQWCPQGAAESAPALVKAWLQLVSQPAV